ncbi:uncharacterized protein LOC113233411 [Hyposmocoma kahamanoa]|uniref:uncharacterized protein LOC113233411 n=1 Tax=Hyposmocoma kahamanoa TaxID=1477025 RepID=UPI000E6D7249|nr:uncharacterized protein LOC113233411 [Hyposmocoma kahamanoa]
MNAGVVVLLGILALGAATKTPAVPGIKFKQNPAIDNHRCGVCPTYFQKICAFSFANNATYIFDNHCIMDVYNCIEGTDFITITYEHCVHFGNFAYVHGYKYEDEDYGEDNIIIKSSAKNPPYV